MHTYAYILTQFLTSELQSLHLYNLDYLNVIILLYISHIGYSSEFFSHKLYNHTSHNFFFFFFSQVEFTRKQILRKNWACWMFIMGSSDSKEFVVMHETQVWSLGWEDTLARRREWLPTPVFLPEKSHEQRSLVATVHGVAKSCTQLSNSAHWDQHLLKKGERSRTQWPQP